MWLGGTMALGSHVLSITVEAMLANENRPSDRIMAEDDISGLSGVL